MLRPDTVMTPTEPTVIVQQPAAIRDLTVLVEVDGLLPAAHEGEPGARGQDRLHRAAIPVQEFAGARHLSVVAAVEEEQRLRQRHGVERIHAGAGGHDDATGGIGDGLGHHHRRIVEARTPASRLRNAGNRRRILDAAQDPSACVLFELREATICCRLSQCRVDLDHEIRLGDRVHGTDGAEVRGSNSC